MGYSEATQELSSANASPDSLGFEYVPWLLHERVGRCHDDFEYTPRFAKENPDFHKNDPLQPIAWTKSWTGNAGKEARVFHVTMGSAKDYQSAGLRRLTANAVYWGLGMEKQIDPQSSVEYVDEYNPLASGFNYEKLGVEPKKPAEYR